MEWVVNVLGAVVLSVILAAALIGILLVLILAAACGIRALVLRILYQYKLVRLLHAATVCINKSHREVSWNLVEFDAYFPLEAGVRLVLVVDGSERAVAYLEIIDYQAWPPRSYLEADGFAEFNSACRALI